jgi:hypothetical protein
MRRSSRWRGRRLGRLDEFTPLDETSAGDAARNGGDRDLPGRRRASDALTVEASVLARLFGIRLLTLDANVILSRPRFSGLSPVPYDAPVRSSREAAARPPERSRAIGAKLADAERLIDEGVASLAASPSTRVASPRAR